MPTEHFELVDRVFCALADRKARLGADSITDIERVVLLVWHASGIIGNGGLRYFIECGLPLRATAEAYARIGVEEGATVLHKLGQMIGTLNLPDDHDRRQEILADLAEGEVALLDGLEQAFYATDEFMENQLAAWIRFHRDVFGV